MIAYQKLWKMLFILSKKLFSFSRYSNFCIFSPAFNTFQIQKSKWKWNILWCHELGWTYRPSQIPRKETALRVHKNSCKVLIPLCKNNSNLPMCLSFFFLPSAWLPPPLVHCIVMVPPSLCCADFLFVCFYRNQFLAHA